MENETVRTRSTPISKGMEHGQVRRSAGTIQPHLQTMTNEATAAATDDAYRAVNTGVAANRSRGAGRTITKAKPSANVLLRRGE
jgi:hypothetical protein